MNYVDLMPQIVSHIGLEHSDLSFTTLPDYLPILEYMRREGAVVLVDLNGDYLEPDDLNHYSVSITNDFGKPIRTTGPSLAQVLADAIVEYAQLKWDFPQVSL